MGRRKKSRLKKPSNSLTIPSSLRKEGFAIRRVIINPQASPTKQLTEKRLVSYLSFSTCFTGGKSIALANRLRAAGKIGIATRKARDPSNVPKVITGR